MIVAAVDIGSNTVRLLIRDEVQAFERRVEVVGLGIGVGGTGLLSDAAMERALAVLGDYATAVRRHGVDAIAVVATAAARDAGNAGAFLAEVGSLLGAVPRIIAGAEEAELSFAGASTALPGVGTTLVVDPGGRSTEFAIGSNGRVEASVSVALGSVGLTDHLLPDRPPTGDQMDRAQRFVQGVLPPLLLVPIDRMIGVAGTFTSLAAIALDLPGHDPDRVHGTSLTLADLDGLVGRLLPLTVAETAAIPALDPGRAPVLLAGALIVREVVARAGCGTVTVSEADLLDEIARRLL